MQVIININPNRQEHSNKRDAGHVLPRDHDQEPKKSFVGWDQEYSSSTTKDQGKNNMGSEMKSMRKPGEESLVVKQEYLSDNVVERDTKPKPVVDNPTGYDPFLSSKGESTDVLGGGDSNQDDLLSKEKKKGGRSTPYSDPSKNVVDGVARTSSPLEKEKKGILSNGTAGQYSDSPKMKATEEVPSTVAREKNVGLPPFVVINKFQAANDVSSTTQNGKKEAAPFFVAEKNIAVPLSTNIEARGNKTSTTSTGSYGKGDQPKKGGCPCSIL